MKPIELDPTPFSMFRVGGQHITITPNFDTLTFLNTTDDRVMTPKIRRRTAWRMLRGGSIEMTGLFGYNREVVPTLIIENMVFTVSKPEKKRQWRWKGRR